MSHRKRWARYHLKIHHPADDKTSDEADDEKPDEFRILLPALRMLDEIQRTQGQPAALAVWDRAERDAKVAGDPCITEQHVRKAVRAIWCEAQNENQSQPATGNAGR